MAEPRPRPISALRRFLTSEAGGGMLLMAAAALALVVANSPLAPVYQRLLHRELGPMSVQHWINDGLLRFAPAHALHEARDRG